MNVFKLSVLASLVGISSYANAIVSGSADVTVTGSLNGSNQCTLSLDNGAAFDSGVHHIADLGATETALTTAFSFNTAISCVFPTAIAVKFTSSLPDSDNAIRLGSYKTSTDKEAAHINGWVGSTPPTAGGVEHVYATVGHLDFSTISGSDTFTSRGTGHISGHAGEYRNAFSVVDSNSNPVASTSFVLPFIIRVYSADKSSGWHNDIADGILSLSSTVTLELHTL